MTNIYRIWENTSYSKEELTFVYGKENAKEYILSCLNNKKGSRVYASPLNKECKGLLECETIEELMNKYLTEYKFHKEYWVGSYTAELIKIEK